MFVSIVIVYPGQGEHEKPLEVGEIVEESAREQYSYLDSSLSYGVVDFVEGKIDSDINFPK